MGAGEGAPEAEGRGRGPPGAGSAAGGAPAAAPGEAAPAPGPGPGPGAPYVSAAVLEALQAGCSELAQDLAPGLHGIDAGMAELSDFMLQADADVTERLEASRADLSEISGRIQTFYAAAVGHCQGTASLEAVPWGPPDATAAGVLQGGTADACGGSSRGTFTFA